MSTVAIAVFFTVSITGPATFHGVHIDLASRAPTVVATCTFEGGGAISDAPVKVFAPSREGEAAHRPYQTGRTDARGRFAFVPDGVGVWRIEVDDGMGHSGSAGVEIEEAFFGAAGPAEEATVMPAEEAMRMPVENNGSSGGIITKMVIGIGLIAILAGLLFVIRAGR
jgi:nickel transport protein